MLNSKKMPKSLLTTLLVIALLLTNIGSIAFASDLSSREAAKTANIEKPISSVTTTVVADKNGNTKQASPNMVMAAASDVTYWTWTLTVYMSKVEVKLERTGGTSMIIGSGTLKIKDSKGNQTATYSLPSSAVLGTPIITWTWNQAMSTTTVEEAVSLSGNAVVTGSTYPTSLTVNRDRFDGGAYSSLTALDGQRHHMFASWVYSQTTVYKYDTALINIVGTVSSNAGPAVLMKTTDHYQTASYGGNTTYRNTQLDLVKQKKYLAAMDMDKADLKSKFGTKYDYAVLKAYNYAYFTLNWWE
ncbi:MAG TPA: hypothetical protein VIO64_22945 [Pseudobacteroides sp.]|uniref:hypothetical protein n=1 Tax=Pseudobacteroides sp. TaxID=1968840 RepID=UPI002F95B97E